MSYEKIMKIFIMLTIISVLTITSVLGVAPNSPTLNSPSSGSLVTEVPTLNVTVTDDDSTSLNVSFYDVSNAWNIEYLQYTEKSKKLNNYPNDIEFSKNGTIFTVHSFGNVENYYCNKPYDISSCNYKGTLSLYGDSYNGGFAFGNNGYNFYEVDNSYSKIFQYTCTVPYNITSCSYDGIVKETYYSGYQKDAWDVKFNDNGTKCFTTNEKGMHEYSCTNAWNVSSCNYTGASLLWEGTDKTLGSFFEGNYLYNINYDENVYQYYCNNSWNLSSCTYIKNYDTNIPNMRGITFSMDGDLMYVTDSLDAYSAYQFSLRDLLYNETVSNNTDVTYYWDDVYSETLYNWKTEVDDGSSITISDTWNFTTGYIAYAPDQPVLNYPLNGTTIPYTTNTILNFTVTDGNEENMTVKIYDASNDNLLQTYINVTSGSNVLYNWTGLLDNTDYNWYVKLDDGIDNSSNTTSALYNFHVNSIPNVNYYNVDPDVAKTNDTVTFNMTCVDNDAGQNYTAHLEILLEEESEINYTQNIANNTNTLLFNYNLTDIKSKNITGKFSCDDGYDTSSVETESINIASESPKINAVGFNKDTIYSNESFVGVCNSTDVDSSEVSYNYKVYKNGGLYYEGFTYDPNGDNLSVEDANSTSWEGLVTDPQYGDDGNYSTAVLLGEVDSIDQWGYFYTTFNKPVKGAGAKHYIKRSGGELVTYDVPNDCLYSSNNELNFQHAGAWTTNQREFENKRSDYCQLIDNSWNRYPQSSEYNLDNRNLYDTRIIWLTEHLYFNVGTKQELFNFSQRHTSVGDEFVFSCQATDGINESDWENSTVLTVGNKPPTTKSDWIRVVPADAKGNNDVRGEFYATDLEGDDVKYEYRFLKNGQPITNFSNSSYVFEGIWYNTPYISHDLYNPYDNISAEVRLWWNSTNSTEFYTSENYSVTIGNNRPTNDYAQITNTSEGDISAIVKINDLDETELIVYYRWYVNNTVVKSGNYTGLQHNTYFEFPENLHSSYINNEGDSVKLSILGSDGNLNATTWEESNEITFESLYWVSELFQYDEEEVSQGIHDILVGFILVVHGLLVVVAGGILVIAIKRFYRK